MAPSDARPGTPTPFTDQPFDINNLSTAETGRPPASRPTPARGRCACSASRRHRKRP